jgi:NAD(P) transhydrogenase
MRYDLVVIGSDPAGQWGAIAAARLKKRVAIVEHRRGTVDVGQELAAVSAKTLREAIVHVTDIQQREAFGNRCPDQPKIKMHDLRHHAARIAEHERSVVQAQFDRNGVDVYRGRARFTGSKTIAVKSAATTTHLAAERIVVACGTKPGRPKNIPFDGARIFDEDELLNLEAIPQSLIVVGGGVTGLEHATMFAALGVRVTVVDGRNRLLEFCDRAIVRTLLDCCHSRGMTFQLGRDVIAVDKRPDDRVVLILESGRRLIGERVLFAAERVGDTADLDLRAAGLELDDRGRVWCSENFRTWAPQIYGAGDVVGFPAWKGTAIEQGRRLVEHAFGMPLARSWAVSRYLNTVPEITMTGQTERQLEKERVPYGVRIARVGEFGRGPLIDNGAGVLKLLFHRATKTLLGVHCLGEGATEFVQAGESVIASGGTVDRFRHAACDLPTLAEHFKVAVADGLNEVDRDQQPATVDEFEFA